MAVFYRVTVTTYFNNLSRGCNYAVDLSKSVTMQSILKKSVTASPLTELSHRIVNIKEKCNSSCHFILRTVLMLKKHGCSIMESSQRRRIDLIFPICNMSFCRSYTVKKSDVSESVLRANIDNCTASV